MAKRIPEQELEAIEDTMRGRPGGVTAGEIADALDAGLPRRTLQYRLKHLVEAGRLVREGKGRWARYRLPPVEAVGVAVGRAHAEAHGEAVLPLSEEGADIQEYVRQPLAARKPAGYNRDFLDSYRPNESAWLTEAERAHLQEVGRRNRGEQPAGSYARQILNRLLIDLSWNSSRLEGNTYSLLDTRRLIEFGEEAEGHDRLEAQMILNHKDAIEFLVGTAAEIGFNRYTILNLHAMLANNLLADESAAGRLRHIGVGIEQSVYHPLEVPQRIEECFDQILASAGAIRDPFEQALFVMAQLPYLQPFDDVNKRVSRLAANIPLIKGNLSPLSFIDVPQASYTDAMLGVYELNKTDLLRDVFIWAYERSAARYEAVRQSLGEPDPFRLKHRAALRDIVADIVRRGMDRKAAIGHLASWAAQNIEPAERERFREIAENELLGLHEGNFARYQIRPAEFAAWQQVWSGATA
jgi:Fic family protein